MKKVAVFQSCISSLLIVLALVMMGALPRPVSAAADQGTCQSLYVPVALGAGQPAQYSIYGQLCLPAIGPGNTIQVLVPGATYDHIYWDFPYQPKIYSYVRAMNAAGY